MLLSISSIRTLQAQINFPAYHQEYCKPLFLKIPGRFVSEKIKNYYQELLSYGFLSDDNYVCKILNQDTGIHIILIKSSQTGLIIFSEKVVGLYAGSLSEVKNKIELLHLSEQIYKFRNEVYKTTQHKYVIHSDRSLPGGLFIRNKLPSQANINPSILNKTFIPISIYNYWYKQRWIISFDTNTINPVSGAIMSLLVRIYIADFHIADALELLQKIKKEKNYQSFFTDNYLKCLYYLVYKFKYDLYSLPREFVYIASQNNGKTFLFQVLKNLDEISVNILSDESYLFLNHLVIIIEKMVDKKFMHENSWKNLAGLIQVTSNTDSNLQVSGVYEKNYIKNHLLMDANGKKKYGAIYWYWPDTRTISMGNRNHSTGHFTAIQKRNDYITNYINNIFTKKIQHSENKSIYFTKVSYPTHPDFYSYTPTGMYDLFVPPPLPIDPLQLFQDTTLVLEMNYFIRMRTDVHIFPKTSLGNWLFNRTHITWPGIKGYTVLYMDIFDAEEKKWILTHKRIIESIRKDLIFTNWFSLIHEFLP